MELYRKYRPRKFSEVVGQLSSIKMLSRLLEKGLPHALLLVGPSGCGKTTIARILRSKVGCSRMDFHELNAADDRGIDMVRTMKSREGLAPIGGTSKIWLIDECQKMTSDAQSAMLKLLEDAPSNTYYILCTTDPHKLLNTIRTRCTEVKIGLLSRKDIRTVIERVLEAEAPDFDSDSVIELIIDKAEGSARKALVLLEQVIQLSSDEEMIEALQKADVKAQAIELARLLIKPGSRWSDVVKIIKSVDDEPESLRRLVLAYASSVLKGGGGLSKRALFLIDVFSTPFYDSGEAGLVAACYTVSTAK